MKVFVTGATGVMGRSVTRALHGAGHRVVGLARTPDRVTTLESLGVEAVTGSLFDQERLTEAFAGCDVVANMATHIPVGNSGIRPGAWKVNDRIRSEGSRIVARAAHDAGVSRLIQESVSFLYADEGDEWIVEDSPIAVTNAAEPVVLAETNTAEFASCSTYGVVLRFGNIVGDDAFTRWRLARARSGHPVGMGSPQSWTHVIHHDDVGTAVVAALAAPSGIFNVGADPVLRGEVVDTFAEVAGHDEGSFYRRAVIRLGGDRLEWLTRSQRISSELFKMRAGWKPDYEKFSGDWLLPATRADSHSA